MIKVAAASDNKDKIEVVTSYLGKRFDITERDDNYAAGIHSITLTLVDALEDDIARMFELIKDATGFDPVKTSGRKFKGSMRAKRAASFILRNRHNLSFQQIATRMGGCNHATILMQLKDMDLHVNVNKTVPIELAVAVVLRSITDKPRKPRRTRSD